MNGNLTLEVKEMFRAVCVGDQALADVVNDRVYTFVPQGSEFPYIRFCNITAADGGTKTSPGQSITMSVDVFDREKSDLNIDIIMRALTRLFHEKQPTIIGGSVGVCRLISSFIQPDSDGTTRHGVARFRLNVYEDP